MITSRSDLSLGSESANCIASANSAKNNVSPADRSVALRLKQINLKKFKTYEKKIFR